MTKCEVKMAGYWPSSFFACLWTETKSRSIKLAKNRTRPISSHLDRTNLVNKGFIIWLYVKFCLRDTAGSPERARWLHLAHSGSQSQRTIWVILPARGASHIIICTYWLSGRAGRENIWLKVRTSWPRAKYFPVLSDLTQSISILSYDHLLLKILKILFEPK